MTEFPTGSSPTGWTQEDAARLIQQIIYQKNTMAFAATAGFGAGVASSQQKLDSLYSGVSTNGTESTWFDGGFEGNFDLGTG